MKIDFITSDSIFRHQKQRSLFYSRAIYLYFSPKNVNQLKLLPNVSTNCQGFYIKYLFISFFFVCALSYGSYAFLYTYLFSVWRIVNSGQRYSIYAIAISLKIELWNQHEDHLQLIFGNSDNMHLIRKVEEKKNIALRHRTSILKRRDKNTQRQRASRFAKRIQGSRLLYKSNCSYSINIYEIFVQIMQRSTRRRSAIK